MFPRNRIIYVILEPPCSFFAVFIHIDIKKKERTKCIKKIKNFCDIEDRHEQCLLNDAQTGRREQSVASIVCTSKPVAWKRNKWQRFENEWNREKMKVVYCSTDKSGAPSRSHTVTQHETPLTHDTFSEQRILYREFHSSVE